MSDLDAIFNLGSVLAVIMAIAAIVVTTRHRSRLSASQLEGPQHSLEGRVNDLSDELAREREQRQKLEATVATLQNLLYEKQNEINRMAERIRQLEQAAVVAPPPQITPTSPREDSILVLVSDEAGFDLDLAALTGVQDRTGLRFTRLRPGTREALERKTNRARSLGKPVRYVHFAVRSGPEGVTLGKELVTPAWLARRLAGAEIVVIAGCRSDAVGDWIRSARNVITMREELTHEQAAGFTLAFWTAIGEGLAVNLAFERALDRAPSEVSEFVELHG